MLYLCCTLLVGLPATASAVSVNKILRKHAQAMGGLDKWQALSSYRMVLEKSENRRLVVTCKMPHHIVMELKKGLRSIRKGYDGEHEYLIDNGYYQPLRSDEATAIAEEPTFYDDLLQAYANGAPVRFLGEATVDGIACYKLSWKKTKGDRQIYWINKSTFLIEQTETQSKTASQHETSNTIRLKDYRWVEGYRFPFYQMLISGEDRPSISIASSVEINVDLKKEQFKYEPDSPRNLIAYWKDRYAASSLKSFTFVQETVRYNQEGEPQEPAIWYEAVNYPDQFRIDFGHAKNGNTTLWRNDSIYVLRKGEWKKTAPEIQQALLMKGGFYHLPVDLTMAKLAALAIDTSAWHTHEYEGRKVYVLGTDTPDQTVPQIWLDAERRNVVKRTSKLGDGRILDVQYSKFVQVNGYWVESYVTFYIDGKLLQTEVYKDINTKPALSEQIFDPQSLQETAWY